MDIAKLGILIDKSGINPAISDLKDLSNQASKTENSTKGLSKSFVDTKGNLQGLNSSIRGFNGSLSSMENIANSATATVKGLGAVAGVAAVAITAGIALFAAGAKQLVDVGEKYAGVNARLKILTSSQAEYNAIQKDLYVLSQETRSGLQNTIDLYAKVRRGTQDLNLTEQQRLDLVRTLNQASVLSGASNEEQANSLRQLMQAMQGGILRAEEFNSVNEQTPRIIQALAEGLGVTSGELRKLVNDGKITSDMLVNGIAGGAAKVKEEFDKMPPTIEQAKIGFSNMWENIVNGVNDSTGYTTELAKSIQKLTAGVESNSVSIVYAFNAIARSISGAISALGSFATQYNRIAPYINAVTQFGANGGFNNPVNIIKAGKAGVTEYNNTIAQQERAKQIAANIGMSPLQQYFIDKKNNPQLPTAPSFKPTGVTGSGGGGGRSSGISEAQKQAEAIKRVNEQLQDERLQLIMNDEQYKLYNSLKQAGLVNDAKIYSQSITNGSVAELSLQAQGIKTVIEDSKRLKIQLDDLSNNNNLFGLNPSKVQEQLDGFGQLKQGVENWANGLGQTFVDLASSADVSFGEIIKSFMKMVAEILIQYYIIKPILAALGLGGGTTTATPNASGNAFSGGETQKFAGGGAFTNSIVSRPTLFDIGVMGEAGDEAIMPLTRIGGSLGVKAIGSSSPNISINIVNNSGSQIKERTETTYDGENYVVTTFLEAVVNNKGGAKDLLKKELNN